MKEDDYKRNIVTNFQQAYMRHKHPESARGILYILLVHCETQILSVLALMLPW
jgi:hypothetical protein